MESIDQIVNKIFEAYCLDLLATFPDASIQLVICDLPYGVTRNECDIIIPFEPLWKEYQRIIRPGGVIILTGQNQFTGKLINSNPSWFKYKIVWIKSSATNFLNAKKQPLRKHEDICVFYDKQPAYSPQMLEGKPYDSGLRKGTTASYGVFNLNRTLKNTGLRYPTDVYFLEPGLVPDAVYFPSPGNRGTYYHSTQKPIELGRMLIRTFTQVDDVVLDNACGSGTFLEAAVWENRKFIGIEKQRFQKTANDLTVEMISACKKKSRFGYEEALTCSVYEYLSLKAIVKMHTEKKTQWVPPFRVTPSEYAQIQGKFQRSNCKFLGDFIRRVLIGGPITAFYRNQSMDELIAELIQLRKELNAIGRNLNTSTRRLQATLSNKELRYWTEQSTVVNKQLDEKVNEIFKRMDDFAQQWLQE